MTKVVNLNLKRKVLSAAFTIKDLTSTITSTLVSASSSKPVISTAISLPTINLSIEEAWQRFPSAGEQYASSFSYSEATSFAVTASWLIIAVTQEMLAVTITKPLVVNTTTTEEFFKSVVMTKVNTTSQTEVVTLASLKSLLATSTVSELVSSDVTKVASSLVAISENVVSFFTYGRAMTDTVASSELWSRNIAKTSSFTAILNELVTKATFKAFSETSALVEDFLYELFTGLLFNHSFQTTEIVSLIADKQLSVAFSKNEEVRKLLSTALQNNTVLVETLVKLISREVEESFSTSDTFVYDLVNTALNKTIQETLVNDELITKSSTKWITLLATFSESVTTQLIPSGTQTYFAEDYISEDYVN